MYLSVYCVWRHLAQPADFRASKFVFFFCVRSLAFCSVGKISSTGLLLLVLLLRPPHLIMCTVRCTSPLCRHKMVHRTSICTAPASHTQTKRNENHTAGEKSLHLKQSSRSIVHHHTLSRTFDSNRKSILARKTDFATDNNTQESVR